MLSASFSVAAFAQTAAPKIGLVNPLAFDDEKEGITKYFAALKTLEAEFKVRANELSTMRTRIETLEKEIVDLQARFRDPKNTVPIPQATLTAKTDEYQRLTREFKFKGDEYKAALEKREAELRGPIRAEIGKAFQEFTKKNSLVMVLDVSKLDEASMLLAVDEAADMTKAFIVFFNARTTTTATTTTPK
jgi:Skp family chaperone for outer membrane proteins